MAAIVRPAAIQAARKKAEKRKQELIKAQKERVHKEKKQLTEWFVTYDQNKSGVLEHDQLKQLLRDCFDGDPDDAVISVLMEKAGSSVDTTGDGVADARGVPRDALADAIHRYHSYLKEKHLIDKIFDEFDKDKASARARRARRWRCTRDDASPPLLPDFRPARHSCVDARAYVSACPPPPGHRPRL